MKLSIESNRYLRVLQQTGLEALLLLTLVAWLARSETSSESSENPGSLDVVTRMNNKQYSLEELSRIVAPRKVRAMPRHGRQGVYRAIALLPLLGKLGYEAHETIEVRCADGYAPRIEVSDLENQKVEPYLAYEALDADARATVAEEGNQRKGVTFSIIWVAKRKIDPQIVAQHQHLPWPYRIEMISVVDKNKQLPEPETSQQSETLGQKLFVQHCWKCHAINQQGGTLGPELQQPKNITEYRSTAYLKSFIRDPQSFRVGSAMPAFGSVLNDSQVEDIIRYLLWLRSRD